MCAAVSNEGYDRASLNGMTICVVSPRRLEYQLLASFLERELDTSCDNVERPEDLAKLCRDNGASPKLVLWDCYGKTEENILDELSASAKPVLSLCPVCLFNVPTDMGLECDAIDLGVKGFIYETDSLDSFVKGARIISTGELWISRRVLNRCIESNVANGRRIRYSESKHQLNGLTQREVEILSLIAVGSSNTRIADELCISCHTVKTHLYNIFRKINASNRLQAALWASKNL